MQPTVLRVTTTSLTKKKKTKTEERRRNKERAVRGEAWKTSALQQRKPN